LCVTHAPLYELKMALSFQRYKLKTNLGIAQPGIAKVSGTSTEALDDCLRRVRRCLHDLRVVQSQLGDFLHHKRAAFAAGRGFAAALSRFFQNSAIEAVTPVPARGNGSAQHDPNFTPLASGSKGKMQAKTPNLKPMEDMFRAGSAGPSMAGAVEHITEGIQMGVGSQLEKTINQLAASEHTMDALKHGELFKKHDHYQQKVSHLETKHTKHTSKLSQQEKESEERAAAEKKAQEELEKKSNVFTSAITSANEPEWLKEANANEKVGKSILGGAAHAERRPTYDPVKDFKALDKQRRAAAAEAEKVSRNQGKSAEAARKYFVATDEAMDVAELLLVAAAPLVAHLTAVFRAHHELLAASVHRLASVDAKAVTVSEAVHPEDQAAVQRVADLVKQAVTAAKVSKAGVDGSNWVGGSSGSGEALSGDGGEESAANSAALEDLREQTIEELKRTVHREAKSCEGTVLRKGWVSKTPYFVVVRGSCLELYSERIKYDHGKAPEETLRLQVVESTGETRPTPAQPPSSAQDEVAVRRRSNDPSKPNDSTAAESHEDECADEATVTVTSPGMYSGASDLGDLLVLPSFGAACYPTGFGGMAGGAASSVGLVGGTVTAANMSAGVASFKISAVAEVPAHWSEEEVRLSRLDGTGAGGASAAPGDATTDGPTVGGSSSSRGDGKAEVQKLQLSFEGRSDKRLRDWSTVLNACCAWEHGVVSVVPLLQELDNAQFFAELSRASGGSSNNLKRLSSFVTQGSVVVAPAAAVASSAEALLFLQGSQDSDSDEGGDKEDVQKGSLSDSPPPPPHPSPSATSSSAASAPTPLAPKSSKKLGLRNPFARNPFGSKKAVASPVPASVPSPSPVEVKDPALEDNAATSAEKSEGDDGNCEVATTEETAAVTTEETAAAVATEETAAVTTEETAAMTTEETADRGEEDTTLEGQAISTGVDEGGGGVIDRTPETTSEEDGDVSGESKDPMMAEAVTPDSKNELCVEGESGDGGDDEVRVKEQRKEWTEPGGVLSDSTNEEATETENCVEGEAGGASVDSPAEMATSTSAEVPQVDAKEAGDVEAEAAPVKEAAAEEPGAENLSLPATLEALPASEPESSEVSPDITSKDTEKNETAVEDTPKEAAGSPRRGSGGLSEGAWEE